MSVAIFETSQKMESISLKKESIYQFENSSVQEDWEVSLVEKFGLTQATILTAVLKGSIFLIGIAIMGVLEPRTLIPVCGSGQAPNVQIYQFPLWPHIEAYTDYRDLYLPCLISPFLSGHGPYHLNTIVYNYPPLFLYLISAFALIANTVWLPAFPLVLLDILTVIPLYLIAKEFVFRGNSKLAFVVALFWAANPINLFYNDLMWLNTAPTTFFLIAALYLFLKQRWVYSALALAISTGFKQISVIIFPILLIFLWKATGFSRKLAVYTFAYVASLLLISAPYVFTDTQNYFWSLNFPIFGIPKNALPITQPTFSASLSQPVRITTFFGFLSNNMANLVTKSYEYLDYVLAAAFAILLVYLVIESVSWPAKLRGSASIVHSLRNFVVNSKVKRTLQPNEILAFCLTALLIFLALFGRGVYKYYFASITPLGLPMFRYKFGAAIFEVFSIVVLLVPREATPWMAILLLTFLPRMLEP
jgi:hypothetical protein